MRLEAPPHHAGQTASAERRKFFGRANPPDVPDAVNTQGILVCYPDVEAQRGMPGEPVP
jgi:hypothetical protein